MIRIATLTVILEILGIIVSVVATFLWLGLPAGLYIVAGWLFAVAWAINRPKDKPNAI